MFDRVKSVALWSAKKKEKEKTTIKGYGSAANCHYNSSYNNTGTK
jgi:hypothetical protein